MNNRHDKILFWGCFIALITTSYAFISRMILCGGQFVTDFGLDKVVVGELQGAGIWPFGVSIIMFSLFIDRIGYKVAMVFSFVSYLIYTAMAFAGLPVDSRRDAATRWSPRRSTATNCSTGAASFSAWATAAWSPTSIPSSPPCSTRTRRNGSTACTPAGRAAWCSADFARLRSPRTPTGASRSD